MKKLFFYILCVNCILLATTCKKAFTPALLTTATNYLAVDGAVISGDSTFITLSRSTALTDTTQNKPEIKALVSVESDEPRLYALNELGKGKYALGVTSFSTAHKYRLDIKTSDGKIYQSDFVPMKLAPPIDSITIKSTDSKTGTFYVYAHDPTNNTRYYRWDYKEIWSYVSMYPQHYQYKNGVFGPLRTAADSISTCYRSDLSNQIFIGSSVKQSQDIITKQPLGGLVANTEKVLHVYVMQLHQYALTEDGYNYYQNLKNNTEQLGSIFDAQPTLTKGNIHCITAPTENVLGFVSVSSVSTKQLNLNYNSIPIQSIDLYGTLPRNSSNYFPPPYIDVCTDMRGVTQNPLGTPWLVQIQDAAFPAKVSRAFAKGDSLVFDIQVDLRGNIIGYYYAPKFCIDCRTKGGTSIRPSYFPPY